MVQLPRDCFKVHITQTSLHFLLCHLLIGWKWIQATVRSTELLSLEINIRCIAVAFHRLFCFP
jgi:hypothetical protein